MSLKDKTSRAVRITVTASVISGLTQAAVLVVLARLLAPADYGLVAGAQAIIIPIQNVLITGIESSMVLQAGMSCHTTKRVFFITVGLSMITCFSLFIVLHYSPIYFEFRAIVLALAPLIVMSAIGLVARAQLRREMAFARLAIADTVAQVVGFGVLSIVTASWGLGAWSLVIGYLAQGAIHATLCIVLRGSITEDQEAEVRPVKSVFLAAYRLSKISIVETVHGQIPSVFVGGYLGVSALGQFNRSYSLITMPIQVLTNSISRVLFTSFIVVREDREKLRKGCGSLIKIAAAVILPLCFGIAAAAPELVAVMLGRQWHAAATLMPWLAAGTAANMIGHLFAVMNEAVRRLEEKFIIQVVTTGLTVGAFLIAVPNGLEACAVAYAFSGVVALAGQLVLSMRVLKIGILVVVAWLVPGALCAIAVVLYVFGVQTFRGLVSEPIMLGLDVLGCALVLVTFYTVLFKELFFEILHLSGIHAISLAMRRRLCSIVWWRT